VGILKYKIMSRSAHTIVITADLESLVAAHEETDAAGLLVLQQSGLPSSTLSPLLRSHMEAIQLSTTITGSVGGHKGRKVSI